MNVKVEISTQYRFQVDAALKQFSPTVNPTPKLIWPQLMQPQSESDPIKKIITYSVDLLLGAYCNNDIQCFV